MVDTKVELNAKFISLLSDLELTLHSCLTDAQIEEILNPKLEAMKSQFQSLIEYDNNDEEF
ncbi:MAG TPA: hypothetical protein DDW51_05615 [Cyanobacteria bacterium UBA11367]|nr:hypothetical protein [Cyanobacteria bacterium UBA11367]HBE56761.1 hypothetical protein [Cyanobacteria bacterium UBA11366]HCA95207.1 hypothetical protein [Cyanobacteria bacterium UBA9226]